MTFRYLRTWLAAHALVDVAAGVALFVAPAGAAALLGRTADPVVMRLVASAILAFGLATAFAAGASRETQRIILASVLAWNTLAILALLIARQAGDAGTLYLTAPFLIFGFAFTYYMNLMARPASKAR